MLPLVFASAFAVKRIWQEEQSTAIASLHKTVDAVTLRLDADLQSSIAALYALGNSEHLQTDNFEAFYVQAKAVNRTPETWVALLRADGSQILNTAVPYPAPPPPSPPSAPAAPPAVNAPTGFLTTAFATQKPVISDVFVGPRTGRHLVAVYVPAQAVGEKKYVLAQGFALTHWKNTAKELNVPSDWIVAVVDRTGQLVARSHKSEEYVGKLARPELLAATSKKDEGMLRTLTLEGIDSYVAFDNAKLTGWTIAVAAPVALIDAPGLRAVKMAGAGFIIATLVSGILAFLFGRRFIAAVHSASTAAVSLGRGQTPALARTSIVEVDALNQSLVDAGQLLEQERQARITAELERERLLHVERLARDAAQKENTAKDHFLAMLGHELRNPLAAISGAVSVLTRGDKNAAGADRYLSIIRRQNQHLVHIVDDLLDMSRLIAGKIVLDLHPVDLGECLLNCVDGLKAAHRVDGHTLSVTAEPVWVKADPVRIEQIFINLIGNALKFSPAGTLIKVDLHAAHGQAVMCVRDQGSGMTAELMARVFEPFVQGPPPSNVSQSGMGIGLALVKQLIELHGGTVSVASAGADQGSTFTCHFPTVSAPASHSGPDFAHVMAAQPRKLLYVEDIDDARTVMSEMLRLSGYEVIEAASGAEALAAAALHRPDAIVLDIGLPDMNGYELARQIRLLPNFRNRQSDVSREVPIIALTGYGLARDKNAAAQVGFGAHLVKPVDPDELMRTVEALLAGKA